MPPGRCGQLTAYSLYCPHVPPLLYVASLPSWNITDPDKTTAWAVVNPSSTRLSYYRTTRNAERNQLVIILGMGYRMEHFWMGAMGIKNLKLYLCQASRVMVDEDRDLVTQLNQST